MYGSYPAGVHAPGAMMHPGLYGGVASPVPVLPGSPSPAGPYLPPHAAGAYPAQPYSPVQLQGGAMAAGLAPELAHDPELSRAYAEHLRDMTKLRFEVG